VDIEELQTFVEIADAGGISPAALRLGVSKSVVSRRLGRLESDLGTQLLSRTTRGAALTEAGVTFRDYAARVCGEIALAGHPGRAARPSGPDAGHGSVATHGWRESHCSSSARTIQGRQRHSARCRRVGRAWDRLSAYRPSCSSSISIKPRLMEEGARQLADERACCTAFLFVQYSSSKNGTTLSNMATA